MSSPGAQVLNENPILLPGESVNTSGVKKYEDPLVKNPSPLMSYLFGAVKVKGIIVADRISHGDAGISKSDLES